METKNLQDLARDLKADLMNCITDPYGPHTPEWRPLKRHWDDPVHDGIIITTEYSRDDSRSNNGGEYYFYGHYAFCDLGVIRKRTCSCDRWQPDDEPTIYAVALSQAGLEMLAELAAKRVSAELTPKPIDIVKVRRRVEDALRKTASGDDLIAIAGLLGVKIE